MSGEQAKSLGLIVGITLVSGIADAQGFLHAAKIWPDGALSGSELGKSAIGFSIGIATYWLSLKYMRNLGVVAPEIQTLIWFGVTLVGVAIASGKIFRWPLREQGVALIVLVGIGWLLYRSGN